ANQKALSILGCDRAELVGLSLNDSGDEPPLLVQLKKVIAKLGSEQLDGLLWRWQHSLDSTELLVSLGTIENTDNVLSLMLYPLPALAQMVVEEFSTDALPSLDTSAAPSVLSPQPMESPQPGKSPQPIESPQPGKSPQPIESPQPLESPPLEKSSQPPESQQPHPIAGLPIAQPMMENIDSYLDLHRNDIACGALLLIDLDHFNSINESLGKHVGTQILERVAETIALMLDDRMQFDQVAGDAFLLFIKDLAESSGQAEELALALANNIRCTIARPFFTENGEVIVTASVGISLLYQNPDQSHLTANEVIQQAESAMFEAKRRGRDGTIVFDTAITRQAQQRISLQSSLRKAVVNQEFDLYLQPQVSTHNGSVVGGEVLLRWIHSGHAIHTPADFIPILEASGMIVDVGLWVIRTSCEYLRNMLDRGLWTADMRLGVNISPKQFHDPGLVASLEHSLKSYDISPDMLTLEVTENLLIDDFESVVDKMKIIRDMGTRFAIDDFGSGYSSMIYLKRLPLDILKIDREFIANLNSDKDTLGLVEAIMMVSRHYGLDVVAEGVEKREVLEVLRSLGCDKYQGAHFSMPVSLDRFQKLLAA
ncbi:MAG: EAL domain-containing protein, partial [Porticoccaceae bacterium]